jgi:uncharacterized protein
MNSTSAASVLREARELSGMTQDALARRAGTSQPAVAAYETSKRTPTLATLERLLTACGRELVLDSQPDASAGRLTLAGLRRQRAKLLDAATNNGVTNVQVFGSVARREAGATSDVDLLVDLEPGRTLVDLAAFRGEAAAILGTPVDVATLDVLKPSVRKEALREAVPL